MVKIDVFTKFVYHTEAETYSETRDHSRTDGELLYLPYGAGQKRECSALRLPLPLQSTS